MFRANSAPPQVLRPRLAQWRGEPRWVDRWHPADQHESGAIIAKYAIATTAAVGW